MKYDSKHYEKLRRLGVPRLEARRATRSAEKSSAQLELDFRDPKPQKRPEHDSDERETQKRTA